MKIKSIQEYFKISKETWDKTSPEITNARIKSYYDDYIFPLFDVKRGGLIEAYYKAKAEGLILDEQTGVWYKQ